MSAILTTCDFLFTNRLRKMLDDIKVAIDNNRKFKHTYKELDKLSDKELKDIGIDRSMIPSIARGEYNVN